MAAQASDAEAILAFKSNSVCLLREGMAEPVPSGAFAPFPELLRPYRENRGCLLACVPCLKASQLTAGDLILGALGGARQTGALIEPASDLAGVCVLQAEPDAQTRRQVHHGVHVAHIPGVPASRGDGRFHGTPTALSQACAISAWPAGVGWTPSGSQKAGSRRAAAAAKRPSSGT